MATEIEVFSNFEYAVLLIWIPALQILEDLDLDESLMVEALLIPDDLDSYHLTRLMISASQDLTERTFSKRIDDFIAEHDVVSLHYEVIASLVIVAVVVCAVFFGGKVLLAALANEVDVLVLLDLLQLVLRQIFRPFRDGSCKFILVFAHIMFLN